MDNLNLEKLVPNARFDTYELTWYVDVPANCKEGFVGVIRNYTNREIEIKIEIDNEYIRNCNYRTCALWVNDEDYYKSRVVLTTAYYYLLQECPELVASLWHEIGHFHTLHYFSSHFVDGSMNAYRVEMFEKGIIVPEEEVADLFALYYSLEPDMVKTFNWLIKTRRTNPFENQDVKNQAVRELCARKRKVVSLEDNEASITNRLCELCNVVSKDEL